MIAQVGDKKPCIADGCVEDAVCIAAYTDYCMGTLDGKEMAEWRCPYGHGWIESNEN